MSKKHKFSVDDRVAPQLEVITPLPPLTPYERCSCGSCRECRSNAKWDEVFTKFEVKQQDQWDTRGLFQSTLRGW